MENSRFDDLTRSLAQARSRRSVLRSLVGVLAGGLAGARLTDARAQRAPRQSNGASCARAIDCASFICVDGVCCNRSCPGQCESCATGACQPVSGPPPPGKPPCPGDGPCALTCDGVTRTRCAGSPAPGTACAAATCANGWLTTYTCGGNGTCVPTTTSCAPYSCADGTACATGCQADSQCGAGAACVAGQCQTKQGLGATCTAGNHCQSGVCAQGVCCASECAGACQSCTLPGNVGFCTEIPDGDPCAGGTCCDGACVDTSSSLEHCGTCDHACRLVPAPGTCEGDPICQAGTCIFTPLPAGTVCREVAGDCDVAEVCNGAALACPADTFLGGETTCRQASCEQGVATLAATCSGSSPTCPDPVREACSPYLCGPSACLATCAGPDNEGCVLSHHCDDGVCLADEGLGASCNEDSDCQSGVCTTGGVCCNQDCEGECVTCTAATNGVCTSRTNQPCGAGATCLDGDTARTGGSCTAMGTCQAGTTVECAPYGCGDGFCRTICAEHGDCAVGYHCDAPACVPDLDLGATCGADDECASGICNPTSDVCCTEACAAEVGCTGPNHTCTPTPTCGGVGQACCAGAVCTGTLACTITNVCASTCGGNLAFCCADGSCDDGFACIDSDNLCHPCGTRDQFCCAVGVCGDGLACDSQGVCRDATPNGQPCTASGQCQSGICNSTSDVCCSETCGENIGCTGPNATCTTNCTPNCTDKVCGSDGCGGSCGSCVDGQTCNEATGTCSGSCGNFNQDCCEDNQCNGTLVCNDRGSCLASCGEQGEYCCVGSTCHGPLVCGAGFCNDSCGGPGEGCCASGTPCQEQERCSIFAMCEPCGIVDTHCCSAGYCDPDLVCGYDPFDLFCRPLCGRSGRPCCDGTTCESGLNCDPDTICRPPVGAEGGFCRPDGSCDSDLVCANDVCVVCGGFNQTCCASNTCDDDLVCNDRGSCLASCGEQGEYCCVGSTCHGSLVCGGGFCVTSCGGPGEGCCSFDPPCQEQERCSIFAMCEPCGTVDTHCCSAGYCDPGLVCGFNPHDLFCRQTNCGDEGEECCPGSTCNNGLTCNTRHNFTCERCGEPGNICCPGNTCNDAGHTCQVGDCAPCGAAGQDCCVGDTCNSGLECRGACLPPIGG